MKMRSLALFPLAVLALAGCPKDSINCDTNGDCTQGGIPGVCLPSPSSDTSWCAFNDSTCPSGMRWGHAAGDGLDQECVDETPGPDASVDAAPEPDAEPPPALSSKIFVVEELNTTTRQVEVVDTATLTASGASPVSIGQVRGAILANGALFLNDDSKIVSLDPVTNLIRSGYPKTVPTSACSGITKSLITSTGIYCFHLHSGSETVADDELRFLAAPDYNTVSHATKTPAFVAIGGSDDRVGVAYGSSSKSFAEYLPNLTHAPGSPATHSLLIDQIVYSKALNRIAIAGLGDLQLYDATTLAKVGPQAFYSGLSIDTIAFDEKNKRLIIGIGTQVTSRSTDDGSEVVALSTRATGRITSMAVDITRDRIYLVTPATFPARLIVLDPTTLAPVTGSPVSLTKPGSHVVVF